MFSCSYDGRQRETPLRLFYQIIIFYSFYSCFSTNSKLVIELLHLLLEATWQRKQIRDNGLKACYSLKRTLICLFRRSRLLLEICMFP